MTATYDTPVITTEPTITQPTRTASTLKGIPLGYLFCEIRRPMRRTSLVFNLLLPAVLYLALFRTGPSNVHLPHGNFAMWMMLGIAVYGAATASTSSAASIAMEKATGWMRTMRLTPLSTVGYVITKVIAAMCTAILPVSVVGLLGLVTGAHGTWRVWVFGLLAAWGGAAVFSALGIALGLALKTDVVMHVPGLATTGLGFLGGLFLPLTGIMLTIGRYTPMYGISVISRYALNNGHNFSGGHDSLKWAFINTGCWLVGFVFWASRRFAKSADRV